MRCIFELNHLKWPCLNLTFALYVIQIGKLCRTPISCTVTGQEELELDDR